MNFGTFLDCTVERYACRRNGGEAIPAFVGKDVICDDRVVRRAGAIAYVAISSLQVLSRLSDSESFT